MKLIIFIDLCQNSMPVALREAKLQYVKVDHFVWKSAFTIVVLNKTVVGTETTKASLSHAVVSTIGQNAVLHRIGGNSSGFSLQSVWAGVKGGPRDGVQAAARVQLCAAEQHDDDDEGEIYSM